jgi:hypothetical protein
MQTQHESCTCAQQTKQVTGKQNRDQHQGRKRHNFSTIYILLYRMSQEERSESWEVIVSVILSKKVHMYMCPIPKGFRDRAISLYSTLYTVQTSNAPYAHMNCKVHWCCRWNFRKYIILGKLYKLCHLNHKYRYSFGSVQWNSSISESVRNWTHIDTSFLLRMTDTMTSQNLVTVRLKPW